MSQSEDDKSCHLSSFSVEECICSSPFALESSEIDITSEVDVESASQDALKSSQTNSNKVTLSFENSRTNAQEPSKVKLSFKGIRQNELLGSETKFSEILDKMELQSGMCSSELGEVVETDETNADLEEGEIQETSNEKSVDTYNCRYYQMGSCVYGKDCRFFHLSEKGLYRMFDLPVSVKNNIHHPSQFLRRQKNICVPPVSEDRETSWDRALREAMDRIESKNKIDIGRENLRMTIRSVNYTGKKLTPKESPPNNSYKQSLVRKARSCSRSKRKIAHEVTAAKPKSSSRDHFDLRQSSQRWKTPKDMRWSPKSISGSSRSRSRSRSSCDRPSYSFSSTPIPKRDRRILSSRITSSYCKLNDSSNSESSSTSSVPEKGSRCIKYKKRKSKLRLKRSKISDCHSPVKILLPKDLESSRPSRRDVPRRAISPKLQVVSKSPCTKTYDRNSSDMSISPLSDSSNRKGDRSVVCCSSDRHVTDMSISPISDVSSPSRFLGDIEGNDFSVSKSKIEESREDVKTGSPHRKFTKSVRKNTSGEKPVCSSSNISNHASGANVKKNDSLLMDLMKFHGYFKRDDSFKEIEKTENVQLKTPVQTGLSLDKPTDPRKVNKVKQKTGISQSKLSKKEILLKRLQEINAAIERKALKKV